MRRLAGERIDQGCKIRGCTTRISRTRLNTVCSAAAISIRLSSNSALLASPIHYVDAGDPPMLLLHGRQDCVVAVVQSQAMHAALQKPVYRANCV